MSRDNLVRWKLRVARSTKGGVHPLIVTSLRVWPTARPEEAREVQALRENPEPEPDLVRHGVVRG